MILALRLLTPAGFMPDFDRGAVTIIACPDADAGPTVAITVHHHQHGNGHREPLHQPCPYASAAGLGVLAAALARLVDVLILAAALLLGGNFLHIELGRAHERPPLRGPPLLA